MFGALSHFTLAFMKRGSGLKFGLLPLQRAFHRIEDNFDVPISKTVTVPWCERMGGDDNYGCATWGGFRLFR